MPPPGAGGSKTCRCLALSPSSQRSLGARDVVLAAGVAVGFASSDATRALMMAVLATIVSVAMTADRRAMLFWVFNIAGMLPTLGEGDFGSGDNCYDFQVLGLHARGPVLRAVVLRPQLLQVAAQPLAIHL